jgi:biopolymer transport protein ExbD
MEIPSPRPNKRARIEIIPLIDIIFFLLATFVMVSLSMVKSRGIRVSLPAAATSEAQEARDFVSIGIDGAGVVFWEREAVTREELSGRLQRLRETTPDAKVFLKGDSQAHLGDAIGVLDAVRRAGLLQVAIETRPEP